MTRPLFMVDHMLIKLGKYLRILGYDAAWDPATPSADGMEGGAVEQKLAAHRVRTHELIRRANAEGRIFLTRNTRLPDQYPAPDRLITIAESDPVKQLQTVITGLNLDTRQWLFSRCVRCNVELRSVAEKKAIEQQVHPNVYARYRSFYACPSCGTVFWKGSHVRNTCAKLGLEDAMEPSVGLEPTAW